MKGTAMRPLFATILAMGPAAPADTPLETPHPSYDLYNMRPDGFDIRAGGIDFFPDGRMAVSDWGADMEVEGKVYVLTGMDGTDRSRVQWTEFANTLKEPLGLKIVDNVVYVLCKDGLWKLEDRNNDGKSQGDEMQKVVGGWSYPPKDGGGERWHLFNFGLVYKDGFFYGTLGSEYPPSRTQGKDRGSLVKMDAGAGTFEILTGGLRTPNGLEIGPEGEFFGSENQGHFMPSNKLNNFREGRNYGMRNDTAHPYDVNKVPESPPAVWIQHGEVGLSPAEPLYVTKGTYAGQLFLTDVSYGGLQRIFLEKVDDEWQGAAFRMAGGFEAGTNRIEYGPDGHIYVGQIGNGGTNWGWRDKRHGLSKLVHNGKLTYEILAVRSRRNGMEIEFTGEVGDGAGQASNYQVRTWVNETGKGGYGEGNKRDPRDHAVNSVRASAEKKRVFLEVDGLQAGRVVYVRANVNSAEGETPWAGEAWYTLNAVSQTEAFSQPVFADARLKAPEFLARDFRLRREGNDLLVNAPFEQDYSLTMRDLKGRVLAVLRGDSPRLFRIPVEGAAPGKYSVEAALDDRRFLRTVALF